MYDLVIARILHIVGVVLWIGGVAFVTTVLLPTVKQFKSKKNELIFLKKQSTGLQNKQDSLLY